MENAIRLVITILFIALIAVTILFFGLFGLVPLKRAVQGLRAPTSTEEAADYPAPVLPATSSVEVSLPEEPAKPVMPEPLPPPPPKPEPPAAPSFVSFVDIKGENGKLSPDSITVPNFNLVRILFTAVDADYNISFPDFAAGISLKKGESGSFQFQASPVGEYRFTCDVCVPPFEGMLIVQAK